MKSFLFVLALIYATPASAQSVPELIKHYSGRAEWDASKHTLTFASTGTIRFEKPSHKEAYWDVPKEVSRIVIGRDVRVTGAFHTRFDCTIAGEDRKTSVVFGTPEQRWADNRGVKPFEYCQFQNRGGVLTVSNLTAINPFAYFIRGWGKVCHAKGCTFIDNRGGWANHSDGFAGGHGSTIDGCHFATGDDAIKLYFDITVTNTTIEMIQNCVPFQFGWGTYQNSKSEISNVVITGTRGRSKTPPIFQWKEGSDRKTVRIDGLKIDNPNARLFDLNGKGRLDLEITGADIAVKDYGTAQFDGRRVICGTQERLNRYRCGGDAKSGN
ncbi:hypothetical protein HAHE_33640 [Haloferula helveola]|uniref:Right handed beta helix region n=1 Tax=Haloferula helveola TaxID=490095 RepID=A0ABN6H728_9BACT|nr:hypothetical protein HAHE_33640 [Haloferula helveola]